MTFAARVVLPEVEAGAVGERISRAERLAGATVDLHEEMPGHWEVTVYFDDEPTPAFRAALDGVLGDVRAANGGFTICRLPDSDWVAMSLAALAPVRAGPFLVHGRHDRNKRLPNDIAIEIEAALAFGTGHHGTTAGCLLAIEQTAKARRLRTALDLGTGTGVLAIAIARRTTARVVASDIDPVAVATARQNAYINGVAPRVRVVVADGLRGPAIAAAAPYDLIVANILAGPLVVLAPAIRRSLAPGGTLILSGLLLTQERRVAAIYRAQGLRRVGAVDIGEWGTLMFRRAA